MKGVIGDFSSYLYYIFLSSVILIVEHFILFKEKRTIFHHDEICPLGHVKNYVKYTRLKYCIIIVKLLKSIFIFSQFLFIGITYIHIYVYVCVCV